MGDKAKFFSKIPAVTSSDNWLWPSTDLGEKAVTFNLDGFLL